MKCGNCGVEISDNFVFCPKCGFKLKDGVNSSNSNPKSTSSNDNSSNPKDKSSDNSSNKHKFKGMVYYLNAWGDLSFFKQILILAVIFYATMFIVLGIFAVSNPDIFTESNSNLSDIQNKGSFNYSSDNGDIVTYLGYSSYNQLYDDLWDLRYYNDTAYQYFSDNYKSGNLTYYDYETGQKTYFEPYTSITGDEDNDGRLSIYEFTNYVLSKNSDFNLTYIEFVVNEFLEEELQKENVNLTYIEFIATTFVTFDLDGNGYWDLEEYNFFRYYFLI